MLCVLQQIWPLSRFHCYCLTSCVAVVAFICSHRALTWPSERFEQIHRFDSIRLIDRHRTNTTQLIAPITTLMHSGYHDTDDPVFTLRIERSRVIVRQSLIDWLIDWLRAVISSHPIPSLHHPWHCTIIRLAVTAGHDVTTSNELSKNNSLDTESSNSINSRYAASDDRIDS